MQEIENSYSCLGGKFVTPINEIKRKLTHIKAFIFDGSERKALELNDIPEIVKEGLAKVMDEELGRTFVANPYFDELLIFGGQVFTSQEKFVPIECNQCEKRNLYEKREKDNKGDFIKGIQKLLEENKNPEWPFKDKLLLQFSVSSIPSLVAKIDLDNLAKTIFDTFKGLVYEEDNQIVSFAGDKNTLLNVKAFIIAIRKLEENEKPSFQDYLFSGKMNAWNEERRQKEAQNRQTRFMTFGEFKY